MNKKSNFGKIVFLFITGLFIFLLYYFWGGVTKPELEVEPIVYPPEKLREQEELWDYSFSEEDLYAVQRNVDYEEEHRAPGIQKGKRRSSRNSFKRESSLR